ncbi:putative membrane protein [Sphaerochaeta pleomorpha str. Grapes]|uniref:Putative membrane protein n=1 Tax=Sphaerochaeta pleomorpha (strain ATCC BAA-1885 / DSM 22778 / Grapes) TaxID=158190 RepID=G8QX04_SPHPG|nr:Na+/H+ antiporter NhaC family protein [Sphaerochaeta pleomorpha]AEV29508.1 putative membrane protein [Sphaerochaeta pleomorpha str. Grapes]
MAIGNKTKREFPNVYVILFVICVFAALLTWIIPAGAFDRVVKNGVSSVVPGSFHFIEQHQQGFWAIFMAIVAGFKAQASLIIMVLFVGAAVYYLQETKALDAAFRQLANSVKGHEEIAIFFIMLVMSIGGATGVFGNVTLVLIPIGVALSAAMGFDPTLGFAMIFFGSFSGFNVGWANFATIGIAQTVAEIPLFSGIGVRLLLNVCNFLLSYFFVWAYFKKIRKDPKNSLNYREGMELSEYMGNGNGNANIEGAKLSKPQTFALLVSAFGILCVVVGALKFSWKADQISATFLIVILVIGLLFKASLNDIVSMFLKGCQSVIPAAFIIGFANAISLLMKNGQILDTIVYYLSIPINLFGPVLGANFMVLANVFINFFISSGSGQATAVMPIMVPIADLTGITRQVAVQAFQFGDGFTNCILPTVGSLMGGLGFAKLEYGKYLKWVWPLILIQILLSLVAITILQSVGWTGVAL